MEKESRHFQWIPAPTLHYSSQQAIPGASPPPRNTPAGSSPSRTGCHAPPKSAKAPISIAPSQRSEAGRKRWAHNPSQRKASRPFQTKMPEVERSIVSWESTEQEIPVFFFRLVTKIFQPWWTVKLGTDLSIYMGVSINGSTPIAGWFIVENII